MIVEYAQLLSTAIRITTGKKVVHKGRTLYLLKGESLTDESPYLTCKKAYNVTHPNHPCGVWARESSSNFDALKILALALCAEYTKRYSKVHKTEAVIRRLPKHKIPEGAFSYPPKVMPEEFRRRALVQSYREFYIGAKTFAKWKYTKTPKWYLQEP